MAKWQLELQIPNRKLLKQVVIGSMLFFCTLTLTVSLNKAWNVLTSTRYIETVRQRKEKIDKLEEQYKKLVTELHILDQARKNMKKDSGMSCSEAVAEAASHSASTYYNESLVTKNTKLWEK